MSHSVLLDRSHSANTTITPVQQQQHHHYHHNGSSKMNGSVARPVATLDSSKHSIVTITGSTTSPLQLSNHNNNNTTLVGPSPSPLASGKMQGNLSRRSAVTSVTNVIPGINHTLASLALMCMCSLFLSFVALTFLQNIDPHKTRDMRTMSQDDGSIVANFGHYLISTEEFITVYEVAVCLATLVVALDLCCLFVCSLQFLFAAKLLLTVHGVERSSQFLHQCAHNRVLAISAFFISIPLFFTALILYAFIHFHSMPAMVTSIVIGAAIIFCGLASIYNVYIWQNEKTKVIKSLLHDRSSANDHNYYSQPVLDLTSPNMELSTLV